MRSWFKSSTAHHPTPETATVYSESKRQKKRVEKACTMHCTRIRGGMGQAGFGGADRDSGLRAGVRAVPISPQQDKPDPDTENTHPGADLPNSTGPTTHEPLVKQPERRQEAHNAEDDQADPCVSHGFPSGPPGRLDVMLSQILPANCASQCRVADAGSFSDLTPR